MVSTMGRDECHAVRVRGEWQGLEGVTRLMVSHGSSGRVSRAWVRSLSTLGGCHAVRFRGLSWRPIMSDRG